MSFHSGGCRPGPLRSKPGDWIVYWSMVAKGLPLPMRSHRHVKRMTSAVSSGEFFRRYFLDEASAGWVFAAKI